MLFEETVPVGTKSLFHLQRDSDEVAWVLAGEITFKLGDDVTVGGPGTCAFFPRNETGRVLFLYTPAAAGGYVEELLNTPGRSTTTNATPSASAIAGKSSVQTRFDGDGSARGLSAVSSNDLPGQQRTHSAITIRLPSGSATMLS